MEDRENLCGTYNKLDSPDEFIADDPTFYSSGETQQVSLTRLKSDSSLNHNKLLVVGLAVLASILLVVDIALGVYYSKLTEGAIGRDISNELARLRGAYNAAIHSRDDAKEQLAKEINGQKMTKWELDHQVKRSKAFQRQAEQLQLQIAGLQSHISLSREGCRHCYPGWIHMNFGCYFIPFSERLRRTTWLEARAFCRRHGADLAVVDTKEKHLAIVNLINNNVDLTRPISQNGFWIGLRDADEEGTWRWLDGTQLIDGYWNDGEPNNQGNEDCAAVYPRNNPFKSWNDAPCSYDLKWICEMPRQ